MSTRPYLNKTGAQLIELIQAGDYLAFAEAQHRSSRKVQAAIAAIPAQTTKTTPKTAPSRPKGAGSRGGDPTKAVRARLADAAGPRGSSAWWTAYRSADVKVAAAALCNA